MWLRISIGSHICIAHDNVEVLVPREPRAARKLICSLVPLSAVKRDQGAGIFLGPQHRKARAVSIPQHLSVGVQLSPSVRTGLNAPPSLKKGNKKRW